MSKKAESISTELISTILLAGNRIGVIAFDLDGRLVHSNQVAVDVLLGPGTDIPDLAAMIASWRPVHEDNTPFSFEESPGSIALRTGEACNDVIMGMNAVGQPQRWLSVDALPIFIDDTLRGVVDTFQDVSKQVSERRFLRLTTEINRVVMSATDEQESFDQLVRALVDQGTFALAWIGVTSDQGERAIDVLSSAGVNDYLIPGMITWSDVDESGRGPVGTALRTGVTQIVNDLPRDSLFQPWRERATEFGLNSCIAIPFSPGGRRAVLTIYDHHVQAFDEASVERFQQIAHEVEFGVAHVHTVHETEEALSQSMEAVQALHAAEQARVDAERHFRLAFEANSAPMAFSDLEDRIVAINDAFCHLVGRSRLEIIGSDSKTFTYPDDIGITENFHDRIIHGEVGQVRYIKRYLHKEGRIIIAEVSKSPATDEFGHTLYFSVSVRDITEERNLAAQLSHQALHDPLTGLANRALFEDRLGQAHARVLRQGGFAAILLIDLDDFKAVNDTYGHLIGDELLVEVAHRLERVTRSADTLCRFGGDEFLYIAEEITKTSEAEIVADRLLSVLDTPIQIGELSLTQHVSLGIAVWDASGAEGADVVRDADAALYEAKRLGKGRYVVYAPGMNQQTMNQFTLEQQLAQAEGNGELSMHFQPIVDLTSLRVVGFEALMRWRHRERGWVPPDVFIPLAEQSELIFDLTAFTLHEALEATRTWSSADGADAPYVSVNLSARQFYDPGLASLIQRELEANDLTPDRLVVEITEGVALLEFADALGMVEQLRHLGVAVALDDFGTGFSSVSSLSRMNPAMIKIDQSIVRRSLRSTQDERLLETVVSLVHHLDTTTLAVGIETSEQLERLRELNCRLGQGFFFSPAVSREEAVQLTTRTFRL